jgi:hypothetical protein
VGVRTRPLDTALAGDPARLRLANATRVATWQVASSAVSVGANMRAIPRWLSG